MPPPPPPLQTFHQSSHVYGNEVRLFYELVPKIGSILDKLRDEQGNVSKYSKYSFGILLLGKNMTRLPTFYKLVDCIINFNRDFFRELLTNQEEWRDALANVNEYVVPLCQMLQHVDSFRYLHIDHIDFRRLKGKLVKKPNVNSITLILQSESDGEMWKHILVLCGREKIVLDIVIQYVWEKCFARNLRVHVTSLNTLALMKSVFTFISKVIFLVAFNPKLIGAVIFLYFVYKFYKYFIIIIAIIYYIKKKNLVFN